MPDLKTHTLRFAPCPAHDIAGTESWLEALAAEGWFLCGRRFWFGCARFEARPPQRVRYRLNASRKAAGILDDAPGQPEQEERELAAACGWQYIANREPFAIYMAADPAAPELNTDPRLQALTLGRIRTDAAVSLLATLFLLAVYPLLCTHGRPVYYLLHLGSVASCLMLAFVLWCAAGAACRLAALCRLHRRLKAGEPMEHRADWRSRARRHLLASALQIAAGIAVWALLFFGAWRIDRLLETPVPLQDYTGPLPFATLADLAEGELVYAQENGYTHNGAAFWSDPLAPVMLDFEQHATVRRQDGTTLPGNLYVEYYETAAPWLAACLAGEYDRDWIGRRGERTPLDLPGVDAAWLTGTGLRRLTLLKGCRVAVITFWTTDGSLELADAAPLLAQRFAAAADSP